MTEEQKEPGNSESGASWMQQEVLNKAITIVLPDERTVSGRLLCVDYQGNIVVNEAVEYVPKFDAERFLGLAIIPGKHIAKILVN